jgi:hypothetical protein
VQPQQNVVISVHCDVDIFERLLAFADKQLNPGSTATQMTNLSAATVMPILIASHFLGVSSRLYPDAAIANNKLLLKAHSTESSSAALFVIHQTCASGPHIMTAHS